MSNWKNELKRYQTTSSPLQMPTDCYSEITVSKGQFKLPSEKIHSYFLLESSLVSTRNWGEFQYVKSKFFLKKFILNHCNFHISLFGRQNFFIPGNVANWPDRLKSLSWNWWPCLRELKIFEARSIQFVKLGNLKKWSRQDIKGKSNKQPFTREETWPKKGLYFFINKRTVTYTVFG